jgi:hypothetical protein
MKLNLNTFLAILGGLGIFAPDVVALASWLSALHVSWLAYPIRGLAALALFFAAAPLVAPKLRAFLALLGLATPPGAQAPWAPGQAVTPFPPPVDPKQETAEFPTQKP